MVSESVESTATGPELRLVGLDEETIQAHTSVQSFKRGETYYRRNYLFNLSVRGNELTASCIGSSGGPYRVTAELAPIGEDDD
ncbi:MAG: SWIM zinc finger family protein, partial [Thermomicrobiales bacterium]